MPVTESWLTNNKIILIEMHGEVTIEELENSANATFDMLNQATQKIYQIIDLNETTSLPSNIKTISEFSRPVSQHALTTWVILYGLKNRLIKFVVKTTSHLSNMKIKVVETQEEALKVIEHLDKNNF